MKNQKKIGLLRLTSLVTGNLVGSGVFLLPSTLAAFGSISILGWFISSIGAILLALVFSYLSNLIPKSGGPYAYAKEAFGETTGFFVCWTYWIIAWISNPALIVATVGYLSSLLGGFNNTLSLLLEFLIIGIITWFNLFSIRTTSGGELIITVLKIAPLAMLPLVGVFYIDMNNFQAFNVTTSSNFSALSAVVFLTIWSFIGVETGTVPAGQVSNAKKTVPLATILGTLIAAFVYILGMVVITGIIPHSQLVISKAPYADAASIIFGGSWGAAISMAAIISCLGALNGWTMVVCRISKAAADENLFPSIFAKENSYGTPAWGIIIPAVLVLPFMFLTLRKDLLHQFNSIIDISITLILFVYLISILAFFKIYLNKKGLNLYRFSIGILSLLFILWALYGAANFSTLIALIAVLGSGLPVYIYVRYKNNHLNILKKNICKSSIFSIKPIINTK